MRYPQLNCVEKTGFYRRRGVLRGGDMRAMGRFREKFGRIRTHLTSLNDQPLARPALVILLFLDLFILIAIFNGLDNHTKQFSSPSEYIPPICREIVINGHWNPASRTDNLSQIVISYSRSQERIEDQKRDRHPVCAPYTDILDQIRKDGALTGAFEERTKIDRQVKDLQRGIDTLKGAYDTSLLETMAKQPEGRSKVDAIARDIQQKTSSLNSLKSRMASLEQTIDGNAKVRLLWERLQGLREEDRQKLLTDLRTLNFWHPVKKLGMQLIFLLPLFAVFYLWNSASIKKNRGIQTLVSSHLLGISFIPIFFKIVESIYDIIPKKLLKQVMDLLESLGLVAIWHYLVMALAIAAALFLIYIFQRKLFSREKLLERRISKGECQRCGKHLPRGRRPAPSAAMSSL